jgi:carbamate kinase
MTVIPKRKIRKPVHINLSVPVHKAFRKACIDKNVTMQEILEYFIMSILEKDEDISKIFVDFSKNKKNKIKKVALVEADELYSFIESGETEQVNEDGKA